MLRVAVTAIFLHVPLENLHEPVHQFRGSLVRYIRLNIDTPGGFIEIVERKEGDRHVVFSHAWSDGLVGWTGWMDWETLNGRTPCPYAK